MPARYSKKCLFCQNIMFQFCYAVLIVAHYLFMVGVPFLQREPIQALLNPPCKIFLQLVCWMMSHRLCKLEIVIHLPLKNSVFGCYSKHLLESMSLEGFLYRNRGARKLMGENLKVVWAKFSSLSLVVCICLQVQVQTGLEWKTRPKFCTVGLSLSMQKPWVAGHPFKRWLDLSSYTWQRKHVGSLPWKRDWGLVKRQWSDSI